MGAGSSGMSGKGKKDWRSWAKRDWLAFDRADYLLTKVILGLAVVVPVVFGVIRPILDAFSAAPLPVSYTTAAPKGIQLPRGAILDDAALVQLQLLLQEATPGERFGQALPGLLGTAATVAVAWLLYRLLRSTEAGEPFTKPNVRRINTIAIIVGAAGMLVQYAQGFADSSINVAGRLPSDADRTLEITFTLTPLVVMLVIALIGEAFRRGVQLRDDVEGLV